MVDADAMNDTYLEWLQSATKLVATLQKEGHTTSKIFIDPANFAKWCADHGVKTIAKARAKYVAELGQIQASASSGSKHIAVALGKQKKAAH